MVSLALIGFFGGLITGISPCILPVLPVIFFSGGVQSARTDADGTVTARSRWRPFLVIGGLVVSFSIFTLVGSLLLSLLNLPQDVLRWAGLIVLVLIGIGLIVPKFEAILEKPFSRIPQRHVGTERGGFLLGIALGAVYVPCAGPVLAAITVAGSTGMIGTETIVLTLSFALGAAIPLLVFALAGRRVAERVRAFRKHQRAIRVVGGVVMIALAIGLVYNVPQLLQKLVPDYTTALQDKFSDSEEISKSLNPGGRDGSIAECSVGAGHLQDCGHAPDIDGIQEWFNTADPQQGVDLAESKGKVVLIDFWAYSCINCHRSIPHNVAWYEAYADHGLEIVGVHSPEYAFEREARNVKAGAEDLGITYPVALDNDFTTWTNYRNSYWPAHYLIDAKGDIRHIKYGEGHYDVTEKLIRELLVAANPDVKLPPATDVSDSTPKAGPTTPETYLGASKQYNYAGTELYSSASGTFTVPRNLRPDAFALDGKWTLDAESITPSTGSAGIALYYNSREVRVVLGGAGTVTYEVDGKPKSIEVSGEPQSYLLLSRDDVTADILNLKVGPGVEAFSFTFG
ncbi:MAG TPA: cytochrome c biogenesis protein CcdA [Glaciibacter sp.]|nr:cytochrome c biogenesis protein CcdA [Glaciibacter sp.]